MGQKVAILGASQKPERFSNKAFHMLKEYGHTVFPIAPALRKLEGEHVYKSLDELGKFGEIGKTGESEKAGESIDTLTMYVGAAISSGLLEAILKLKPKRVIFNPGSENPELQAALSRAGIEVEEACTLVLLRTGQF